MTGGFSGAVNEFFTGADTAPTPQVNSYPPQQGPAKTWNAPDVSAPGQLHVNTSHLTTAADVIKAHLPELDAAVQAVNQQINAFGSLAGWQAGQQMKSQLESLVQQCAELGQQTSDTHAQTAAALYDTASTYGDAEDANTQAASNVTSGGVTTQGSSASSPPSSGASASASAPATQEWS